MRKLLLIAVAGAAAELIDGTLGMGFGVTASTVLIVLAGLGPAQASAIIHTAELGTTLASGVSHWKFGNVDWGVVLRLGVPGAIGAFLGATLLSHMSTAVAAPVTAGILCVLGVVLVAKFARGASAPPPMKQPYNPVFLAVLGVCGGFIDASGGGGWGPVTSSTLMSLGRTEPRRVIGAVNTAEFLVTLAATLGFALGMWHDLVANAVAVAGLLLGGVIAAPLAAWLVSRVEPVPARWCCGNKSGVSELPEGVGAYGVQRSDRAGDASSDSPWWAFPQCCGGVAIHTAGRGWRTDCG